MSLVEQIKIICLQEGRVFQQAILLVMDQILQLDSVLIVYMILKILKRVLLMKNQFYFTFIFRHVIIRGNAIMVR